MSYAIHLPVEIGLVYQAQLATELRSNSSPAIQRCGVQFLSLKWSARLFAACPSSSINEKRNVTTRSLLMSDVKQITVRYYSMFFRYLQ